MKVIGIIPARYGSTRLPAKPLADILGKTMVQRVYETAQKAKLLDSVLVATDDERVATAVRSFGGRVELTSPAHVSGTDRAAEVAVSSDAGIVVNVQGDEPLLDPEMIDECISGLRDAMLRNDGVGLSTIVKRMSEDGYNKSSAVKVVRDAQGRALYFSRSLIPHPHNRTDAFEVFEHIGLYAYTKECLIQLSKLPPARLEKVEGLEQLRALENGILIQAVETKCHGELVSVDTPEDLEKVRKILANGAKR